MMEVKFKVTDRFLKDRPLSASSLKAFGGEEGSPKKYIDYITGEYKETEDFIIGKATEMLIYEHMDSRFSSERSFQFYEPFPKRKEVDKERWVNMLAEAKENKVTLITQEQYDLSSDLKDTALQTEETRYYIDMVAKDKQGQTIIQKKVFYVDPITNLPVVGYIDFLVDIEGHFIIIDIKTDRSGGPNSFNRNLHAVDGHIQVGSYLNAFHKQEYLFPDFMFMVLDKTPPYDAIMVHCTPQYCETAKNEFNHILTAFRHCMNEDQFDRGRAFWSAEMGYFNMDIQRYKQLKAPKE